MDIAGTNSSSRRCCDVCPRRAGYAYRAQSVCLCLRNADRDDCRALHRRRMRLCAAYRQWPMRYGAVGRRSDAGDVARTARGHHVWSIGVRAYRDATGSRIFANDGSGYVRQERN